MVSVFILVNSADPDNVTCLPIWQTGGIIRVCTIYVAPVYRYPEGDSKTPTSHGPYIFSTFGEEFLHYQRNCLKKKPGICRLPGHFSETIGTRLLEIESSRMKIFLTQIKKTNNNINLSLGSQQSKTQSNVLSHRGYQLIVLLPSVPKLSQAKVPIRLRRRKIYFSRLF